MTALPFSRLLERVNPLRTRLDSVRDMSFMLPDENAWAVSLEFEVTEGDGRLITFGSLIANKSNDPSTIEMEFGEHLLAH